MKPAEFKREYYPAIERVCAETGLNPLFVAAQAALESGWGDSAIGNNLFGITAGDKWTGKRQTVRTFEYFDDAYQSGRFDKVYSITRSSTVGTGTRSIGSFATTIRWRMVSGITQRSFRPNVMPRRRRIETM